MLLADLSFCPLLELSNQGVWGMSKPRIAIVTGGGSGLGRALCFELSLEGHFVVVTDLDLESARQVVAELEEVNGQGEALELDVSSQEQVEHVVHDVVRRHGRLDYMFNNAGFAIAGDTIEMTSDQWRKIIAVNLEGVIWGTMAAYRIMAKQRFGHIVNTASCAGLSPLPLSTPYSMTKHAVVGLTRSMRPEADWHGVKLSVACPGFIATKLFDNGVGLGKMSLKTTTALGQRLAISPERAAKLMMIGVRRNLAIIAFPLHGKAMYWIQCSAHWFCQILAKKAVTDFHRKREQAEQDSAAKDTNHGRDGLP